MRLLPRPPCSFRVRPQAVGPTSPSSTCTMVCSLTSSNRLGGSSRNHTCATTCVVGRAVRVEQLSRRPAFQKSKKRSAMKYLQKCGEDMGVIACGVRSFIHLPFRGVDKRL